MFSKVFDFKRFGLDSFQGLEESNNKKKLAFSNLIRIDGFTADAMIKKSLKTNTDDYAYYSDQDVDISVLGDVMKNEDLNDIYLCAIYPNRN